MPAETLRDLDVGSLLQAHRSEEQIGTSLFRALFAGEVASLFHASLSSLPGEGYGLRIRLELDLRNPELVPLQELPWELLCRPETGDFLCLSRRTPIVHSLHAHREHRPPVASVSGLRILAVRGNPTDSVHLDLERELQNLEQAWKGREREVKVDFLSYGGREELRRAFLKAPVHVLHFMGHAHFDKTSGEGTVLLEEASGAAQPVDGRDLAEELRDFESLRLVVLNACDTSRTGEGNPFSGVATAQVMSGVPAVIAMRQPISDEAALAFSRVLYDRLAVGDPVEPAVAEARLAIHRLPAEAVQWSTPVLFLRGPDGRLFASTKEPPRRSLTKVNTAYSKVRPVRRSLAETLGGVGALGAAACAVVSGLGFVTLRAREVLLGLPPGLTYPKQEWLATGFNALGALIWRGLSVLVSEHPVLTGSAWTLLFLLLGLTLAARAVCRPALLLGILVLFASLLGAGSGFYRIALAANSPDADPSQGFNCGEHLSANLADRAAFETCSWLMNDTSRNDGLRKDLGGLLGWLLAACLTGALVAARTPVASRRLSGLRWTLVGAQTLLGLLLLYDLPRAHAFGTWGLRYPQVRIHEKCDSALAQATTAGNCWAFDVSAGAEKKEIFLRGSGCPESRDGSFLHLGSADTDGSECLISLSSLPRVIVHGPNS
ncbi:MAG TPA: CHAT domain-containing protein [Thermoanaerobaculia bacterium]|nr:CHAT domain-containing protein [Thermoanaerobaculia bacterium]